MAKLKITMERFGDDGWEFAVSHDNGKSWRRYRTNRQGCGLWSWADTGNRWFGYGAADSRVFEYKQFMGTGQFWLHTDRKRAYDKIRRFMLEKKEDDG